MNKNATISGQSLPDRLEITLIDGGTLSCALKAEQPDTIKSDSIRIDTVGIYIEWRLHYQKASVLPEGLIWRFAGTHFR